MDLFGRIVQLISEARYVRLQENAVNERVSFGGRVCDGSCRRLRWRLELPDRINAYAKFVLDLGPILCAVPVILIAAFDTHIVATIQLAQRTRSTTASRTVIVSGLIVLCFVIYHPLLVGINVE